MPISTSVRESIDPTQKWRPSPKPVWSAPDVYALPMSLYSITGTNFSARSYPRNAGWTIDRCRECSRPFI